MPGAYYWGDSDNGLIDGTDLTALEAALAGQNPGYWTIPPSNQARSALWQDLDGNGILDAPDYTIMQGWLGNDFSDHSGSPVEIILEKTDITIAPGSSVYIRAKALSGYGKGRAGWGMVFQLAGGSCATARLYGRNVSDGSSYGWFADQAYEYTRDASGSWYASVKLKTAGCSENDTVFIGAYIPGYDQRFPSRLVARNYTDAGGGTVEQTAVHNNTCIDNDHDGRGNYCSAGSDCDDADPDNWNKCATCIDADSDGWYANCDRYLNRRGPDCDDADRWTWQMCNCVPEYCPECVCMSLWDPVCVVSECYYENDCLAYSYCDEIYCYLGLDAYGDIDPNSDCARAHPGCMNQCW